MKKNSLVVSKRVVRLLLLGLPFSFLFFYYLPATVFYERLFYSDSADIHSFAANWHRYTDSIAEQISSPLDWIYLSANFHSTYEFFSSYFGDPVFSLFLFSVVSAVILYSHVIFRQNLTSVLPMILLLHPRFLDLVFGQVRNALALAIFSLIFIFHKSVLRVSFLLLSVSFHLSMVPVILLWVFFSYREQLFEKKFYQDSPCSRKSFSFEKRVLICVVFLVVVHQVLGESDIRGLGYGSGGALYTLMWALTLGWVYLVSRSTLKSVPGCIYSVLTVTAFFGLFFDIYVSRYIAIAVFFLALAMLDTPFKKQCIISPVVIFNICVSYYFWI